jgi:hypothetical protein
MTKRCAAALVAILVGCAGESLFAPPAGAINLSLSTNTLTLATGTTGNVSVTVSRVGTFTGAVAVSVEGLPAGVTAAPIVIGAGQATGTALSFTVAASATPGSSALTVRATGQGVREVSLPLTLVVQAAPVGFTMTLSSPTTTVQQGAQSSVTITIARSGGFSGAVALAAAGLPTGVTASFNPSSVTGTTSTLTLTASAAAPAGTTNVSITGSGTGVPNQTAGLALTVASTGGGNAVSVAFCPATGIPIWVAFQDGPIGSWVRATPANGVYTGTIASGRGALAYVTTDAAGAVTTTVRYGTTAELRDFNAVYCLGATGTGKTVGVTLIGAGGDHVMMGLGTSPVVAPTGTPAPFQNVADGTVDLIAARSSLVGGTRVIDRLVVQRALTPATGSTVAVNFNGNNGLDPVTAPLTISNLNFDQASVSSTYRTPNHTQVMYGFDDAGSSSTRTIAGFPQAAGSFHLLQATAAADLSSYDRMRSAGLVFGAVAPKTITLGPELATVTVTTLSTAPTLRLQAIIPIAPPYHHSWSFSSTQGSGGLARTVMVQMTAGWLGTAAGSVTVNLPDLNPTVGYQLDWGLRDGVATSWSVIGQSMTGFGPQGQFAEGAVVLMAGRFGTRAP